MQIQRESDGVPVVINGRASAVIVIPADAPQGVIHAAEELRHHIKKAAGTELAVVDEDHIPYRPEGRIYLGMTKASLAAGFKAEQCKPNEYAILTHGRDVFISGGDGEGDPLNKMFEAPVGTLFGVYHILDEDLGVRWLWPGDLGEHVPETNSVYIRRRDIKVSPRFRFCKLRTDRRDELIWMRRMRMHGRRGMDFGHAFGNWDQLYGKSHPEWFEMDSEGVRRPGLSMCVSNRNLHQQIVKNWWEEQQEHPEFRSTVNICENDCNGNCMCQECTSWDGPEAPHPRPSYYEESHNVSDRYARFAMEVLRLAEKHDPQAEVTMYSYLNYVFAPHSVKLDKRIIAGFVADVFYPRTAEDHEWVKRQWQGWSDAGASLFLRPNYTLNGYCMPENWARQFADEFKFFEEHGMIGTEFDSLNGQWANQGPVLYIIGRLHVHPKMPVEEILQEYYSGFGPASEQVKAYWEYWEDYTREHTDVLQDGTAHWTTYPKDAWKRFPPESFIRAGELLSEAEQAASGDAVSAARVAFLRTGLEHARLCVETGISVAEADSEAAAKKAVRKLWEFRRSIDNPYITNIDYRFHSCKAREEAAGWPDPD